MSASFVPEAIPRLVADLHERADELTEYLDDMNDFMDDLGKLNDKSKLDLKTLHLIAKVKSPRRAELVLQNDPETVEKITELAFSLPDDIQPLKLLCVMDGINVPTASSVLSWMFPEKWPVIDQRAWRTLHKVGVVTSCPTGRGLGHNQWRVYLQAVRALQAQLGDFASTPQQVDRVLYGLDDLNGGQT